MCLTGLLPYAATSQALEECHGLSIAIDNMGRGQDFLVHQGLDLITIVCRVKKTGTPQNTTSSRPHLWTPPRP